MFFSQVFSFCWFLKSGRQNKPSECFGALTLLDALVQLCPCLFFCAAPAPAVMINRIVPQTRLRLALLFRSFFLLFHDGAELASVSFLSPRSTNKIFLCFVPAVTFSGSTLPPLDKKGKDVRASDSRDARLLNDMRHNTCSRR